MTQEPHGKREHSAAASDGDANDANLAAEVTAGERDAALAQLLDRAVAELRAGRHPDAAALAAERPELTDELRHLLGTLVITEELAGSSSALDPAATGSVHGVDILAGGTPLPERFGGFDIVRELGRGGMGIVYEARQATLDRTVALKVLIGGARASASDNERFYTEARSAARLQHPNIVAVYDVGEHDGQPYFTMRRVDGETLAQRLIAGPLAPRDAAQLLVLVARAVQHAHEMGVLHRDLKPSNVLLDRRGAPHVTDFGLAKPLDADSGLTQTGAILGSPSYMAPEQAAGKRGIVGAATDVYGLGAILYHVLTGRPPFQAATPFDTVLAVLEQQVVPPRVLQPNIDRDLEMICLRCLQKPQDLRYASAATLADDLEAYLRGEAVSARSTGIMDVMSRVFRETPHAHVLENWGLLWMLHSCALLALCLVTHYMRYHRGIMSPGPYIALWTIGLGAWAAIFWGLRRRGGPITWIERQIAHLWGAGIICSSLLFLLEIILRLPVLTLSPVLPLISGSVFLAKAGILSGIFYIQAGCLFALSALMAFHPTSGLVLFGFASAASFFIPGLKYYRQRRAQERSIADDAQHPT